MVSSNHPIRRNVRLKLVLSSTNPATVWASNLPLLPLGL